MKRPLRIFFAGALCFGLFCASSLAQVRTDETYADRIQGAKVFREPLVWIGDVTPPEDQSRELWECVQLGLTKPTDAASAFQKFLTKFPNSAWVPSVQANLAYYYRQTGQYSLALELWQAAWDAVKNESGASAQQVSQYTLSQWSKLLASLGRVEKLKEITSAFGQQSFQNATYQRSYNEVLGAINVMERSPGISYKCGTYALANLIRYSDPTNKSVFDLLQVPSPRTGFSMTALSDLAKKYEIDLVPVQRLTGKELIVPSVIHWKENHYAALVEKKGDWIHVIDPTFVKDKWIRSDIVNSEASSYFLVRSDQKPSGWKLLSHVETDKIFGKGYPNDTPPPPPPCPTDSEECPTCLPGGPGSGGGPPGRGSGGTGPGGRRQTSGSGNVNVSPAGDCGSCGSVPEKRGPIVQGHYGGVGMAAWSVAEPYIELHVEDVPMSYQPSRGPEFSLKVSYHQNETRPPGNTNVWGFGRDWNCNWLTYMDLADYFEDSSFTNYIARVYGSGGGELRFSYDHPEPEERSRTVFERLYSGGIATGYKIKYPNGNYEIYGLLVTISSMPPEQQAFITQRIRSETSTNLFQYSTNGGLILLTNVIDSDGRATRLFYDSTYSNQVSIVSNSFNDVTAFYYHPTNGVLTNIIDVVGISSKFWYTWSNSVPLMTNMATPYGNTAFKYMGPDVVSTNLNAEPGFANINRAIEVTEPTGGKHLFLYRDTSEGILTDLLLYSDLAFFYAFLEVEWAWVGPSYYPESYSQLCGAENMAKRNSFYWGPLQYRSLSTTDPTAFTLEDYQKGRIRNWLHGSTYGVIDSPQTVSHTLNMEQMPSMETNGLVAGRRTWYGYLGKSTTSSEGTNAHPNFIVTGYTGPGNVTNAIFTYLSYNELGKVTTNITTYEAGTGIDTRTNLFYYAANGIDMIGERRLEGANSILVQSNIYNSYHQVTTNYDALMQATIYEYNNAHQVTRIERSSGMITTNVYNGSGDLIQTIALVQTSPSVVTQTNLYSYQNRRLEKHTNELGLVLSYSWDSLGRLKSTTYPDATTISNIYFLQNGATMSGGTGTNILDATGTKDRLNNWTYFGYNGIGRKIASTNALGNYSLWNYCACGALDSALDAGSNYTFFHYDNQGNVTNVVYPGGYAITNFYDSFGRATNVADNLGVNITNFYNNQGLLCASSNAFGLIRKTFFDIEDHATNMVDANGVTNVMTYDELGRMLTRYHADGGVEKYAYNARGLAFYTNQLNKVTSYVYNEARWKRFETNANSEITQFRYDLSGNLTNLIDGKSQNTFWSYDEYSRVTNKQDHLGTNSFIYGYNANGWLTSRITPAKGTTAYSYDALGNLTNVNYPTSTDLTFRYDKLSRLTNMTDAVGSTRYLYTDHVLTGENGPWENDLVTYGYQNGRRKTSLSLIAPNGSPWIEGYTYDGVGRLNTVVSHAGTFTYSYHEGLNGYVSASALVKKLALPNGAYITNSFDSMARLLATDLKNSGNGILNSHVYGYNQDNQRTNQTRTDGDYVTYTYDNIGQLKTAAGKESGGSDRLHELFGYAYDQAGNLTWRTNNALTQDFTHNGLNQLTNANRSGTLTVTGTTTSQATNVTVTSGVTTKGTYLYADETWVSTNGFSVSSGTSTFTAVAQDSLGRQDTNSVTVSISIPATYQYDSNGNLTNDSVKTFDYDDENQLIRVTKSGEWKSEFVYDAKMRRRIRKEFKWQGSAWLQTNEVRYVYDGKLVIQERNANNLPAVSYSRGKDLKGNREGAGGIGGLLARTLHGNLAINNSQAHAYYHADGNGSITMLIDAQQLLAAKYTYDSFGNLISKSGPLADINVYRFSGKEWHEKSGLLYYLYRYYESNLQRWLNRDPLNDSGFETLQGRRFDLRSDDANLYRFVQNDPITKVDPWGLEILKKSNRDNPKYLCSQLQSSETRDIDGGSDDKGWTVKLCIYDGEAGKRAKFVGGDEECPPQQCKPNPKYCPYVPYENMIVPDSGGIRG